MLLAVDHGNYAIKTPYFSFVSGLSEHTVRPPLTDELLEYNSRYWTLSGKRISYMRDKTQDDRFFILTLWMIFRKINGLLLRHRFPGKRSLILRKIVSLTHSLHFPLSVSNF